MKKAWHMAAAALLLLLAGCGTESVSAAETPRSLGSGAVLFDVYISRADADLNGDGKLDRVVYCADAAQSTLTINGIAYTLELAQPAHSFAVTDIDAADGYLELAFTDAARELEEGERLCTYLYGWDGTALYSIGSMENTSFVCAAFNPSNHFDGRGSVYFTARTCEFTDVWYKAKFICGEGRRLTEQPYMTSPLYAPAILTARVNCVLLREPSDRLLKACTLWNAALPLSRDFADEWVSCVPKAGETLTVTRVYGPYWFELTTQDGFSGWLKCERGQVQGFERSASELFGGIAIAG